MQTHNIHNLMSEIRAFVNEPRRKNILYFDSGNFNQLIACLDLIEDCEEAIKAYQEIKTFNSGKGNGYLSIYGLMQSFVMQQDAVRYLGSSLLNKNVNLQEQFPEIETIRRIRNVTVGHAVQNKYKLYTQIVRVQMTPRSIVTLSWHDEKGYDRKEIDIIDLINKQNNCMGSKLNEFINDLRFDEEKHKEKFRYDPLMKLIPKGISYIITKLYVFSHNDKSVANTSIAHIEESFKKIKTKISERINYADETQPYRYICERLEFSIPEYKKLLNESDSYFEFQVYADYIKKVFQELSDYCQSIDEYYEEVESLEEE